MILFSLLAVIMFVSKIVMEALPNIHLLGTLTITYTLVYRQKALIPIYIYVALNGLYAVYPVTWITISLVFGIFTAIILSKISKKLTKQKTDKTQKTEANV